MYNKDMIALPNLKSKPNKRNGFTIIELLIVIMIIGILAGLVLTVINSQGIRGKSRDSQRIADLKKTQAALELYFADNRSYPTSEWINIDGTEALSTALEPDYMSDVPTDPTPVGTNTGPCNNDTNYRYNYRSHDGSYYILTAIMEIDTSNDNHECTSLNQWSSNGSCSMTIDHVCYGVENP